MLTDQEILTQCPGRKDYDIPCIREALAAGFDLASATDFVDWVDYIWACDEYVARSRATPYNYPGLGRWTKASEGAFAAK